MDTAHAWVVAGPSLASRTSHLVARSFLGGRAVVAACGATAPRGGWLVMRWREPSAASCKACRKAAAL